VPVQIHYESRINSRVSITKKGVILRISRYLRSDDKLRQVDAFKKWAIDKLQQRPELCRVQRKDFYSGKVIAVRDRSFVLELHFTEAKSNTATLRENIISMRLSVFQSEEQMEKAITFLISKIIARALHPWVHERLALLNAVHFPQRRFKTLRLKYANSLWGSCSNEGSISISTRLLLAPDEVIDYVLIHELAHLLVPNHSRKFWKLVEQAMPHYKQCELWLKNHGKRCDF
jgi:predicted metal-dependent hydrolase